MPDWQNHDHDDSYPFDQAERLKSIHDLFVAVQTWRNEPAGSSRKLAYDKLQVMHEQAIARFANSQS